MPLLRFHRRVAGRHRSRISAPAQRALNYDQLIKVQGLLEFGEHTDEETGFVSLVRLRDAQYKRV